MGEDGIIQGQVVLSVLTQWKINEGRILLLKMTHYTSSMWTKAAYAAVGNVASVQQDVLKLTLAGLGELSM